MQTLKCPTTLSSAINLAILAIALSACSTQSKTDAGSHEHPHTHSNHSGKQSAVSSGGYSKPGAPITLRHGNNKIDAAGETSVVIFTLTTNGALESVSVSLNGEQLSIAGSGLIAVGDMAAGTSQELTAVVTPEATGRQYLSVIVTGQKNGNSTGRAFSIPIDVAGSQPTLKSSGDMKTDADGQSIISMPAAES